jgi:myb proto-oncogene protein
MSVLPPSADGPSRKRPRTPSISAAEQGGGPKATGTWSTDEDTMLRHHMEGSTSQSAQGYSPSATAWWKVVLRDIAGRTRQQCQERWENRLKPGIKLGPWSTAEDAALKAAKAALEAAAFKGRTCQAASFWQAAAHAVPGRTGKQCRERWLRMLDPRINHEPFSPEEEEVFERLLQIHGHRWSKIANAMPGRTDNQVKTLERKLKRRACRNKENSASGPVANAQQVGPTMMQCSTCCRRCSPQS